MDATEMMKAMDGRPVEFVDGKVVAPKGFKITTLHRGLEAIAADPKRLYKGDIWEYSSSWFGTCKEWVYCVPDPSYNPSKKTETPKKSPLTQRIESREAELADLKELAKLEQEIASEAKATQEKRLKAKLLRIKWKVK